MIGFGGLSAEVFSGIAVLVSGYSLWQTTLKPARLQVFVPPLIRYASPYQNSIFEVFEIPLTIVNHGAQTGTALSLHLEVANVQTGALKHFYSAGLGPWSLAKVRGEGLLPFLPLSMPGHTSQSAVVLFYAREDSHILQVVEGPGPYRFVMQLLTASDTSRLLPRNAKSRPLAFEMQLPYLDHRAFSQGTGTLPLH